MSADSMSTTPDPSGAPSQAPVVAVRPPGAWLASGGTLLTCLLVSLIRAPVPAVNEPHYLAKAKFWWDPAWCAGDFFLESSNPHLVFYAAVGWLTRWLTLEQTAYLSRTAALLLLATGWQRLAGPLFRRPWGATASAAVFLGLAACGNFAGEWLVGGVEGKVFAYGCWLWACACWRRGAVRAAAAWAGATVSFHPVVGVWCLVAAGFVWITRPRETAATSRPSPRTLAEGLFILGLTSLPGLWPALSLLVGGDPQVAREADRIVLTQRLGHHLDPMLFPPAAYRLYGVLLVLWGALSSIVPRSAGTAAWQRFLIGSLLVAAAGLIVGWLPAWTSLDPLVPIRVAVLKFYPFRLADLCLPLTVAVLAVQAIESRRNEAPESRSPAPAGRYLVVTLLGLLTALLLSAPDANASGMTPENRRHWIAACHWLRDHTPPGALIATSNESWAVKWFSDRPEYVNFKDCPQDAPGIVEWRRRRQTLVAWNRAARRDKAISTDDLHELHRLTGIDYLLVNASRYSGLTDAPVYRQGPFEVYRVRP